jgi:hypothetical protein
MIARLTGMALSHLVIGIIVATCSHNWDKHVVAGWVAVGKLTDIMVYSHNAKVIIAVFVWIYIINFAYSWGPGSWVLIAEIFPISIRAKGTSIGASANWMNNFVIAFTVPPML